VDIESIFNNYYNITINSHCAIESRRLWWRMLWSAWWNFGDIKTMVINSVSATSNNPCNRKSYLMLAADRYQLISLIIVNYSGGKR